MYVTITVYFTYFYGGQMETNTESVFVRILLAIVSVLLIVVIIVQLLYSAGLFRGRSSTEEEDSGPASVGVEVSYGVSEYTESLEVQT